MGSRDNILNKIEEIGRDQSLDRPDLSHIKLLSFDDPLSQAMQMVAAVGGQVIERNKDELPVQLQEHYPGLKVQYEGQPAEVLVIKGEFIVAENGAVWYTNDQTTRSDVFLAENLVILLDRKEVVQNMHEAYDRVSQQNIGYGSFISGPSKTADIEQALVIGAQGPKSMTLLIT